MVAVCDKKTELHETPGQNAPRPAHARWCVEFLISSEVIKSFVIVVSSACYRCLRDPVSKKAGRLRLQHHHVARPVVLYASGSFMLAIRS